jgi:hypothetical protein
VIQVATSYLWCRSTHQKGKAAKESAPKIGAKLFVFNMGDSRIGAPVFMLLRGDAKRHEQMCENLVRNVIPRGARNLALSIFNALRDSSSPTARNDMQTKFSPRP